MTDEEKNELNEFIYIVSHDLCAPIRHIREFGKLLLCDLEDKITEQNQEYFDFMNEGLDQVDKMVGSLLEYSRLNTLSFNPEIFSGEEFIEGLQKSMNEKTEDVCGVLTFKNIPNHLWGDRWRLDVLMFHLIGNALKFHNEGSKPEIIVSSQEKDESIIFSIKDNGIGIPKKHREDVFKLFKALSGDKNNNIGMGLTLSKKIVELHSGRIWIEENPTGGTIVKFTLPQNSN